MVLLINNDVTESVLEIPDAINAVEEAFSQLHTGDAAFRPRTDIWYEGNDPEEYYCYGDMLGAMSDPPRVAHRLKSDMIDRSGEGRIEYNVEQGKTMRFVCLFDAATGELLAILNDRDLQHIRVAATAAVACKYLTVDSVDTMGVLGSGGMAHAHTLAISAVRDLAEIRVYSPTTAHREEFAAEMSSKLEADVVATETPRAALHDVDIAATCTNATDVFHSKWLDGVDFLTVVTPSEVEDAVFETAQVFTTTNKPFAASEIGDVENPRNWRGYRENEFSTLAEIVSGEIEVDCNEERTHFYYNLSAGIQFTAVCSLIYDKADANGVGTELPLEWFQQERNAGYRRQSE